MDGILQSGGFDIYKNEVKRERGAIRDCFLLK
jgi:hypothetical protein